MTAPDTCAGSPRKARSEGGWRPSRSFTCSSSASSAAYQVLPERAAELRIAQQRVEQPAHELRVHRVRHHRLIVPGCSRIATCERSVRVSPAHSETEATPYFFRSTAMSADILSMPALPAP